MRRWGITTRWRPKYPYDMDRRAAGTFQAPAGQTMDPSPK